MIKPRIWLVAGEWVCSDLEYACVGGKDPIDAYKNWFDVASEEAFGKKYERYEQI